MIFRNLTVEEEKEFRRWARINFSPGMSISSIWHPVVIDECTKILKETNSFVDEGPVCEKT